MKNNRSKWRRYINIILGLPNKKQKPVQQNTGTEDFYYKDDPSCRTMPGFRSEGQAGWVMKTDFSSREAVIQNCVSSE